MQGDLRSYPIYTEYKGTQNPYWLVCGWELLPSKGYNRAEQLSLALGHLGEVLSFALSAGKAPSCWKSASVPKGASGQHTTTSTAVSNTIAFPITKAIFLSVIKLF